MNLNLKNSNRKIVNELKDCLFKINNLNDHEELLDSTAEKISEISESLAHAIDQIEWTNETVDGFLIELRDRKTEGEVVIDELVAVLCLEKIQKEEI